jgi:hypothetical protein
VTVPVVEVTPPPHPPPPAHDAQRPPGAWHELPGAPVPFIAYAPSRLGLPQFGKVSWNMLTMRCSSRFGRLQRRKEMIEFPTHMPADTVIFITMAVLGLAGMLIALRRLI